MPLENRRDVLIALATEADRLGYEAFCLPETWAYDVTVLLAEAAVKTKDITLGTGILGVWNRSAGTLAMAAATLSAQSGGRFLLGLGVARRVVHGAGRAAPPNRHAGPRAASRRAHSARARHGRASLEAQPAVRARRADLPRRAGRRIRASGR